jgi:hypothetical protein
VWIVDAVAPRSGDRLDAFRALLDVLLADHADARVVSVVGPVAHERLLPDEILTAFGFLSSTQPGLSRLTGRDDTLFVHPLGDDADDGLTVGGVDLEEPDNWNVPVQ